MLWAVFFFVCFVLNKKLESSHVDGSFVICESELMEAKHLTVPRLNMVCVSVCVSVYVWYQGSQTQSGLAGLRLWRTEQSPTS